MRSDGDFVSAVTEARDRLELAARDFAAYCLRNGTNCAQPPRDELEAAARNLVVTLDAESEIARAKLVPKVERSKPRFRVEVSGDGKTAWLRDSGSGRFDHTLISVGVMNERGVADAGATVDLFNDAFRKIEELRAHLLTAVSK